MHSLLFENLIMTLYFYENDEPLYWGGNLAMDIEFENFRHSFLVLFPICLQLVPLSIQ